MNAPLSMKRNMEMPSMFPSRRAVLATGICTLAAATLRPTAVRADLSLNGKAVQWRGSIPGDWLGGNADVVEAAIKNPALEKIRWRFEWLLTMLRRSEVACLHPDVSGLTTKTVTLLRISKIELKSNLADAEPRGLLWKKLAEDKQKEKNVVKVQMFMEQSFTVNGKPAQYVVFNIQETVGSSVECFTFIDLGGSNWHMFNLAADETKVKARMAEFIALLDSVRYG